MTASYKIALGLAATLLVFVVGYYMVQDDGGSATLTTAGNAVEAPPTPAASDTPAPTTSTPDSAAPTPTPQSPPSLGLNADDLRSRIAAARKAPPLTAPPASPQPPIEPVSSTPPAAAATSKTTPPAFELAADATPPAGVTPETATRAPVTNNPTILTDAGEAPEETPTPQPPATAPEPAPTSNTQPAKTYTVQKGDTLETIAYRLYGARSKWQAIAQANPLVDPIKLKIGQVLKLPQADALTAQDENLPEPGRVVMYTVRPGDSLWSIAKKFYGDGAKAKVIHNANRQKIGVNGNNIRAGMKLEIPPSLSPAQ